MNLVRSNLLYSSVMNVLEDILETWSIFGARFLDIEGSDIQYSSRQVLKLPHRTVLSSPTMQFTQETFKFEIKHVAGQPACKLLWNQDLSSNHEHNSFINLTLYLDFHAFPSYVQNDQRVSRRAWKHLLWGQTPRIVLFLLKSIDLSSRNRRKCYIIVRCRYLYHVPVNIYHGGKDQGI